MNILLVEDNKTIIKGLKYSFEKNNYNLIFKSNISDAKKFLTDDVKIDLIILDIALPDGNGFDLFVNNIKSLNYDEESMELVPVTFGRRLGFIL